MFDDVKATPFLYGAPEVDETEFAESLLDFFEGGELSFKDVKVKPRPTSGQDYTKVFKKDEIENAEPQPMSEDEFPF
jgi:hypothetical protein